MDLVLAYFMICGALTLGAMSPGPSFVVIAKIAMSRSRADGLAASLGMGIGGVFFAVIVLLGLQAVLQTFPPLYTGLRVAGALYLLYLAYKIWKGADTPFVVASEETHHRKNYYKSFLLGLSTQISNPKTIVVYGS